MLARRPQREEFVYRVSDGGREADGRYRQRDLARGRIARLRDGRRIAPGLEADLVATDGNPWTISPRSATSFRDEGREVIQEKFCAPRRRASAPSISLPLPVPRPPPPARRNPRRSTSSSSTAASSTAPARRGMRPTSASANGRIAAIGHLADATAKQTIDADGTVVAPGFIDMLGQSELTMLVDPHLPSKIFQGITTEITGEGGSVAPLNDAIVKADRSTTTT